jgi:HD-like signal output (HDOD) protein
MGLFRFLSNFLGGWGGSTALADSPILFETTGVEPVCESADVFEDEPPDAKWWIPRGTPVLAAPPDDAEKRLIDQALYKALSAALNNSELELPRLPETARRALKTLNDPNLNFSRLAEALTPDPAIAAAVLRMANSAYYGGHVRTARVEQACMRLGTRTLRALILAESTKGLMIQFERGAAGRGEELWRRALVSAVTFETFADAAEMNGEEAYLLGLLHDIGTLAVLKVVHEFETRAKQSVSPALFRGLCRKWHEHLGLRLAEAWNLPDPLPDLIGAHHHCGAADDPLGRQRALIRFAEAVRALLEYDPYVPYDILNMPCLRTLGLADEPATIERLAALPRILRRRLAQP